MMTDANDTAVKDSPLVGFPATEFEGIVADVFDRPQRILDSVVDALVASKAHVTVQFQSPGESASGCVPPVLGHVVDPMLQACPDVTEIALVNPFPSLITSPMYPVGALVGPLAPMP